MGCWESRGVPWDHEALRGTSGDPGGPGGIWKDPRGHWGCGGTCRDRGGPEVGLGGSHPRGSRGRAAPGLSGAHGPGVSSHPLIIPGIIPGNNCGGRGGGGHRAGGGRDRPPAGTARPWDSRTDPRGTAVAPVGSGVAPSTAGTPSLPPSPCVPPAPCGSHRAAVPKPHQSGGSGSRGGGTRGLTLPPLPKDPPRLPRGPPPSCHHAPSPPQVAKDTPACKSGVRYMSPKPWDHRKLS